MPSSGIEAREVLSIVIMLTFKARKLQYMLFVCRYMNKLSRTDVSLEQDTGYRDVFRFLPISG